MVIDLTVSREEPLFCLSKTFQFKFPPSHPLLLQLQEQGSLNRLRASLDPGLLTSGTQNPKGTENLTTLKFRAAADAQIENSCPRAKAAAKEGFFRVRKNDETRTSKNFISDLLIP